MNKPTLNKPTLNTSRTFRKLAPKLAIAFVSLVLMAGAALWLRQRPVVKSEALVLPPRPGQPAVNAVLAHLPEWHAQRNLPGFYKLQADFQLNQSGAAQSNPLHLEAHLLLANTAEHVAAGWLAGEMTDVQVTASPELKRKLEVENLQKHYDFAVRVDETGAVTEQRFAAETPPGLRNVLTTLTANLQVTREPLAQQTWTRVEPGADAPQPVKYRQIKANQLQREWARGTAESAPDGPQGHGHTLLTYGPLGLQEATYVYALAVDLTLHESYPQQTSIHGQMVLKRLGDAPEKKLNLADLRTDAQLQPEPKAELVKPTRTVQQLIEASGEAQQKGDWLARRTASRELAATLTTDPQKIPLLLQNLREPGLDGDALRTQVEALAGADTPQTHQAIATALLDPTVPYLARHSLATVVTFLAHPTPAVLDAAWKVALDPQSDIQAAAALGVAAQAKLHETDNPQLAAQLRAQILAQATAWLAGKKTPEQLQTLDERDMWLQALGNMGGEDVWPLVAKWVTDKNDQRRLYAIEALRFVPVTAARVALAKAMQLDPYATNRRRAAEIALYHPQQVMQEPVVRALREDPSPKVRIGAAMALAVWAVTSPGLNAELAAAEAREVNPQTKQILADLQPETLVEPQTAGQGPSAEGAQP